MNIRFNGTRLFLLTLVLLLLKLAGVVDISYLIVFLPLLSPLIVAVYLILFTQWEL